MDVLERNVTRPTPPRRQRSRWLVAAAAFAVVMLLGATLYLVRPADDEIGNQTTTTIAPSTTTTLESATTSVPAPTTTATTSATTTTVAPQTFEAAVTWDGTSCRLDGPAEVSVGDTVVITYRNESTDVVDFWVSYLTSGHTPEDLVPYNGPIDVTSPTARLGTFAILVASAPGSTGFGTLEVGETAEQRLVVKTPRLHVVTCFGGPQPPAAESQLAVSSTTGIAVNG